MVGALKRRRKNGSRPTVGDVEPANFARTDDKGNHLNATKDFAHVKCWIMQWSAAFREQISLSI